MREARGGGRAGGASGFVGRQTLRVSIALGVSLLLLAQAAVAKKPPFKSLLVENPDPADENAQQRGLATEKLTYRSLLRESGRYHANTSARSFSGLVLGYVTPWNARGYDIARTFRAKFTHVAPVWFQLRRGAGGYQVEGGHDVDRGWIESVRQDGAPKIVPRVVLEGWPLPLLESREEQAEVVEMLLAECTRHGFDGLVLEAWSSWAAAGVLETPALRKEALGFVRRLGAAAQTAGLELLLVVPPPPPGGGGPAALAHADLAALERHVSGFSLMTYDFSHAQRPGPSAPLPWVRGCLAALLPGGGPPPPGLDEPPGSGGHGRELKSLGGGGGEGAGGGGGLAPKVLMGLNFYGNDFTLPAGGGPIVGRQFLELVDRERPTFLWDAAAREHRFSYTAADGRKHAVYFPTLMSIEARLQEARRWGAGVSIWELGQGLDYFYDLL